MRIVNEHQVHFVSSSITRYDFYLLFLYQFQDFVHNSLLTAAENVCRSDHSVGEHFVLYELSCDV